MFSPQVHINVTALHCWQIKQKATAQFHYGTAILHGHTSSMDKYLAAPDFK
jgi:hypothetical protein